MGTNPSPDSIPRHPKRLIGVGVFLACLAVLLLLLVLHALGLWRGGGLAWPLG